MAALAPSRVARPGRSKAARPFKIGGRPVGPEHPPLVMAEVGINHEGSFDKAIELALLGLLWLDRRRSIEGRDDRMPPRPV